MDPVDSIYRGAGVHGLARGDNSPVLLRRSFWDHRRSCRSAFDPRRIKSNCRHRSRWDQGIQGSRDHRPESADLAGAQSRHGSLADLFGKQSRNGNSQLPSDRKLGVHHRRRDRGPRRSVGHHGSAWRAGLRRLVRDRLRSDAARDHAADNHRRVARARSHRRIAGPRKPLCSAGCPARRFHGDGASNWHISQRSRKPGSGSRDRRPPKLRPFRTPVLRVS